jgi:hypothetical protein
MSLQSNIIDRSGNLDQTRAVPFLTAVSGLVGKIGDEPMVRKWRSHASRQVLIGDQLKTAKALGSECRPCCSGVTNTDAYWPSWSFWSWSAVGQTRKCQRIRIRSAFVRQADVHKEVTRRSSRLGRSPCWHPQHFRRTHLRSPSAPPYNLKRQFGLGLTTFCALALTLRRLSSKRRSVCCSMETRRVLAEKPLIGIP